MKKRIWLYCVIVLVTFMSVMLCRMKIPGVKPLMPEADRKKESITKQKRIEMLVPPDMVISEDNLHVAWVQLKPNNKMVIAIDGKVDRVEYDDISMIVFSPDTKKLAYSVKTDSKWFVIVNGKKIKAGEFDYVSGTSITFSPDSKRLAFSVEKGGRWYVVLDGKIIPEEGHGFAGYLTFSPDSKHFVYVAGEGDRKFVVLDGKVGKKYQLILKPVFSPDSKHLAYVAIVGFKQNCVVLNGKEGPTFDLVNKPIFSKDSKHIVYSAMKGDRRLMVLDDKEGPNMKWSRQLPISFLVQVTVALHTQL